MFFKLLLCALAMLIAHPDALADTGMDVQTKDIMEASVGADSDLQRDNSSPSPDQPQPFVERHQRELLALLALLILWLVTRVFVQPETTLERPSKRHAPLSADEFGRVIFSIVRGENVAEYRGLYINGPEAVAEMGQDMAATYLQARTPEVFELAFDALFDRVPAGARFEKGHLNEADVVELWVLDPEERRHRIPVGLITHVGAILRLVKPSSGADVSPQIQFTGDDPRT
jgi:hypothetical protein